MAILNELIVKGQSNFIGGLSGNLVGKVNGYNVNKDIPSDAVFTDTTYTGSNGITLSGTNFTNSGVRSIATGSSNGTISVNTNGTSANVAVKGLGTAAYKAETNFIAANSSYINTHPENNPVLIPFINNDIAWLLKRGGSIIIKYDDVDKTSTLDATNMFDGSPSYFSITASTSVAVFELTLHKIFSWTNTIYIDFGSVSWRAKSVKIEVMNNNTTLYPNEDWSVKLDTTTNNSGNIQIRFGHAPVGASNGGGGFNKIRITLSDWINSSIKRIAQIGIYNYSSQGLKETFISTGGSSNIYGSLIPFTTNNIDLGSTSKYWNNAYITNINGVAVGPTPKFTDTTYLVMTGATSSAAGTSGLVPQPASGKQDSFLKGNGIWDTIKVLDCQLVSGDLNNITEMGSYYCGSNSYTNKPEGVDNFNLSVIRIGATTYMQLLTDPDGNMYSRLYKPQASTQWTDWIYGANPKLIFGSYLYRDKFKQLPGQTSNFTPPEVLWGTDYNDLLDPGVYVIRGNSSYPTSHAPNGNNSNNLFYVMTLKYTSQFYKQLAFSVNNTDKTEIYLRSMVSGSWSNWTHINTIATGKEIAEYEEGTFTPVLYETENSNNIFIYDTTNSYASYIKNGNLLQIQIKLKLQTSGINNKQLSLSGLPFIISQSSIFNVNIVHSIASSSNLHDIAIAYPNSANSNVLKFKHIYQSSIGYIIMPDEIGGSPDTTNSGMVSGDNQFTITDSDAIIYISGTTDLSLVTS